MLTLSIFSKWLLLCFVIGISLSNAEISCLICDSKTDPKCSTRPDTITNFESCELGCVTSIDDDGNTIRRCLTSFEDCTGMYCDKCETANCNSDIFPSNRQKCYQCSGSSCMFLNPSHVELPCSKFVPDDKCFTYVFDEKNAVRGCVSDNNRECNEANELCEKCSLNGCNNQLGMHTVNCFHCNSTENRACQRYDTMTSGSKNCEIDKEVSKCSYQEVFRRQGKCYTAIIGNSVVRSCRPMKSDILKNCEGELCNNECFEDRKNCIQCNENDEQCDQENGLESFNTNCPAYTPSCFRCENLAGNETTRGCGKEYLPWTDEQVCTTCYSDGCNAKKPKRACYKCDSRTNPLCSNLKDHKDAKRFSQFCSKADDSCIAMLTEDGYTVRSCMGEIENPQCADKDPNCMKCNSHNCNIGPIPKYRLHCYQCDGETTYKCDSGTFFLSARTCARYIPNDNCYTYERGKRIMVRGCESDNDINSENCEKLEGDKCAKCNSSSCNGLSYKLLPKLKCYKCDKNDIKCPWSYNIDTYCTQMFEYWQEESCFIYKHEDGSVTRGCTLDSELCSNKDDTNCTISKGNNSNKKNTVIQSCYVCGSNGAGEEACTESPDKMNPIVCKNEFISYENRGCYKRVREGQVTRGCLADFTENDIRNCDANQSCTLYKCIPDNCNKSALKRISLLAVLSILFYWTFTCIQ